VSPKTDAQIGLYLGVRFFWTQVRQKTATQIQIVVTTT